MRARYKQKPPNRQTTTAPPSPPSSQAGRSASAWCAGLIIAASGLGLLTAVWWPLLVACVLPFWVDACRK